MKLVITVECGSKNLFDLFMGRNGRFLSADSFIRHVDEDIKKAKKKDPTASYVMSDLTDLSVQFTISGTDKTLKEMHKNGEKDLKRFQNRIALKAMKVKIKQELKGD